MKLVDQQLRTIVLSHLLDFQISLSYIRVKPLPTSEELLGVKHKLLVLLEDCYLIISLYEESKDNKKENSEETKDIKNSEKPENEKQKILDKIRKAEDEVINLNLINDSLKSIEDLYDQILEIFNKYLFQNKT
ncbi:MAG: hypothetical protein NV1_41 [Nanoarchaeotal virus 1]|nr:MAG: hypothetical protein NV1_41 [Nanoarchaeotal virus 1]